MNPTRPPVSRVVALVLLAGLYAVAARFGLGVDAVSGFATLVWPPTGIALAALFLFGNRLWPGVALGALVANVWTGAPLPVALGIALGNTLEAVVGASALRRLGVSAALDRLRDVLALIVLAALFSTLMSATIGVASLWLGGLVTSDRLGETWRAWWLGDMIGNLVVAPLLLTWGSAVQHGRPPFASPKRLLEGLALSLSLVAASLFIFAGIPTAPSLASQSPYLVFPLLIWAGIRFGQRGGTIATAVVSVIAIWGTSQGAGPFAGPGRLAENLLYLQTFMAVLAITTLVLSAVLLERNAALRGREEFLEMVSHDLKTPLNTIRMSTVALEAKLPPENPMREQVALLHRAGLQMNGLIRDLLDLAASESGRLIIDAQPVAARALLEEARGLLEPLAARKGLELAVSNDAGSFEVLCDRERVQRVFSNLIGNAIKFSPEGSTVAIGVGQAGMRGRFSVADAGPGLTPDELRHLFQRYWQARRIARDGSGLGLSIAKGIVEAHGGQIWAESQVGAGTTFYFTLPLADSPGASGAG